MSKRRATFAVDDDILRAAERAALSRRQPLDELVERALRRELETSEHRHGGVVRLPTHGRGGLLAGVDLEDKELMDRLLAETCSPAISTS